jgi:hypothetical protein
MERSPEFASIVEAASKGHRSPQGPVANVAAFQDAHLAAGVFLHLNGYLISHTPKDKQIARAGGFLHRNPPSVPPEALCKGPTPNDLMRGLARHNNSALHARSTLDASLM